MTDDSKTFAGPYPTPEGQGIDSGYEVVRAKAEGELEGTLPGPSKPLEQVSGEGIKNPEGEFAIPALIPGRRLTSRAGPALIKQATASAMDLLIPRVNKAVPKGASPAPPPRPWRTESLVLHWQTVKNGNVSRGGAKVRGPIQRSSPMGLNRNTICAQQTMLQRTMG
jgi:hypothetical protein